MKTIFVPAFDTPLVSLLISNRVGTTVDGDDSPGLVSHAAELSLRGAGQRDRAEFDESIDALGASIGFALRRDSISLRANCLERHVPKVFGLARDVLSTPRLSAEEHEKLQRETLWSLDELRDNDSSLVQRFFAKYWHPGHVYCRTSLGTAESVAGLELSQVRDIHARLLRSEDLVLGVCGPLSDDRVAALAAEITHGEGQEPLTPPSLEPPPRPRGRRLIIVDKPGRQQCQVAIGHILPAYGSADFDSLRVAEAAFGGMFTSRLMQEIRVKHGWSYGAQCTMYHARGPHCMQLSLAPGAEVCVPAIARTLELLTDLKEKGLEQEEFEFTRAYLTGSAAFSRATATQRLSRRVQEEVNDLPEGYEDGFSERLEASTCAQVNEVIARCLTPGDLCVVVVATAEEMQPELESLGFDSVEVVDYRSY